MLLPRYLAVVLALSLCRSAAAPAEPVDESAVPASGRTVFRLPAQWSGAKDAEPAGNPLAAETGARWQLDQIWPSAPLEPESYRPMRWNAKRKRWAAIEHAQGGQPSGQLADGVLELGIRGPWGGGREDDPKSAALSFVVPADGEYRIDGELRVSFWANSSEVQVRLVVLPADGGKGRTVFEQKLRDGESLSIGERLAIYAPVLPLGKGDRLAFTAEIRTYNSAANVHLKGLTVTGATSEPPPDYVTIRNGHLYKDGQRVRYWAVIGGFPNIPRIPERASAEERTVLAEKAYRDTEAIVQRFIDLGFNMSRFWRYAENDYTRGDGSREDIIDHFVYTMKRRGLKIWVPNISGVVAKPEHVGIVDDPATAEAWQTAMHEAAKNGNLKVARVWDSRLEAYQRQVIERRATHRNRYTGMRWCDDPVFAVWELTNEEWWMSKMVGGTWHSLPDFFRNSLKAKWHDFLRTKYGTEAKLVARWGFLLPGEKLAEGSIQILPLKNGLDLEGAGMDVQALKQMKEAQIDTTQTYSRDDFNRHRGEDVIEFFLSLQLAHKKRLAEFLRGLGTSTQLAPICHDTGIGYEIQSQYMHQSSDVSVHDAYINGTGKNTKNPRYPWITGLEEPPRISHDVPWLEHNRVPGKPFFCYETQIQQPAKYRSEFPLRILALASIQDWDIVCWHYWGSVGDVTSAERPFDKAMDVTTGGHPQGYHYTYDEVQNAIMRGAGYAFRNLHIPPAPEPTTFIYGRRSLYDPASMDYAGSYGKTGLSMLGTTYQYGVRLVIDPSREKDEVIGPVVRIDGEGKSPIIRPNDQITFDTQRGGIVFDSPGCAAFTGFMTRFGTAIPFAASGVQLEDVAIQVPPTMPYAEGIADERYVSFVLTSMDSRPLAETKRAMLSLSSTSFNTGFQLGRDAANGKPQRGQAPVLTARVDAVVAAPALTGMHYVMRDWHMQPLAEGTVRDGTLHIPGSLPVFTIDLSRD